MTNLNGARPVGTSAKTDAGAVEANSGWAGFCLHAKAIGWAQDDTSPTIEQVKEHNALGKKHCGWKGAPPPIQLRGIQTGK